MSLSWTTNRSVSKYRVSFRTRFHRREDRSKIRVWERESRGNEARDRPKSVLNEDKRKAKGETELDAIWDDGFRALERKRGNWRSGDGRQPKEDEKLRRLEALETARVRFRIELQVANE